MNLLHLVPFVLLAIGASYYLQSPVSRSFASSPSTTSSTKMSSSALFTAVGKEDLEAVDAALKNGENPNTLNDKGQ